jgi:polar amino acid transport system substrate-binding protein
MHRKCSTLVLVVLLGGLALPASWATPLNFCYEDAPQAPWTMPDGSGLNFELLRRAARLTGDQFVFHMRPWKRCMEETRNGQMDGMVGPSDSPERRLYSVPPLLPDGSANPEKAMYQDRVDVYLRVGSGASWDGKELHNPGGVVVAQRGYHIVDMLKERGQRVMDTPKSAEEGLRLLAAGTADVAVLQGRAAAEMVRNDPRFAGRIALARQPFVVFDFYLVVSRKTYEREPHRIEDIWRAIAQVRATPEYRKLEAAEMRPYESD